MDVSLYQTNKPKEDHLTQASIMAERPKTSSHLIGGFVGGLTSAIVLQPFDLLKTRLQQNKDTTLWGTLKDIRSPKQLWRGALPSSLRTSIGSALYLSTLNVFRTAMAKGKTQTLNPGSSFLPQLTMYENLASGAFTRGVVGFITMPITIIKVRYESTMYSYKSLGEATRHIYSTEGIRGFFNGCGATVMRDAPYAGLYVLLYEKAKLLVPMMLPSSTISYDEAGMFTTYTSTVVNSISAFMSASLATTITSPFDTIKTRMQLDPTKFSGFYKTLVLIVSKEKFKNLFDGLTLRLTRKAFSAGIAWGIYEELIKRFMAHSK